MIGQASLTPSPISHSLCHPDDRAAQAPPVISARPFIGTLAVLLGSIISTLDNRITSFGLADVEGAVHAGFDEGAWITTAFTVGQMMVGPAAAWFGMILGPRRVLMFSASVFCLSNLLLPLSPNLHFILAFQLISGLSSGTFIPLTLGFVVQSLPARFVIYGVSAYAMNIELSLNVASSIEGYFETYWSWPWIFWDSALLAPVMLICIHFGMPRQTPNMALFKTTDWGGILFASLGLSLIYAALDQGNRLDWLNSGLITGLLLAGGILIVAFVVHELTHDRPWINLRFAASGNIPLLFFYISFFRVIILSTSFIIPQYLLTLQDYRALEVGSVCIWVAMPQFLLAPIIATILRFIDARITLALGFCLVGFACLLGSQLTDQWAVDDFLPGLIIQAVGQSFALTSLVWFALKHLQPSEALTFGAVLQTGRLFGGEVGAAFIQTLIRTREQTYSNLVGLHVVTGAFSTVTRLEQYGAAVFGRSIGDAAADARAVALLAQALRRQAYVLAYIDGFVIMGIAVIFGLLLMVFLRDPPAAPGRLEHQA
jgi:MFS transporter, DHA2 family, multidrug resistance protein